jgi:hypothetical protein
VDWQAMNSKISMKEVNEERGALLPGSIRGGAVIGSLFTTHCSPRPPGPHVHKLVF